MHDAKTNLSRYLAELHEGETIVLCRRNIPVAEIRLIGSNQREPAAPGRWKGKLEVPPEFFEPLPDDLLDSFEGRGARARREAE